MQQITVQSARRRPAARHATGGHGAERRTAGRRGTDHPARHTGTTKPSATPGTTDGAAATIAGRVLTPRPRDDARRDRQRRRREDRARRLLTSSLLSVAVVITGLVTAGRPGPATASPRVTPAAAVPAPSTASGAPVYDLSWPQCRAQGGVQPMPPTDAAGVVLGITGGRPFTRNTCLGAQAGWATAGRIPVQVYTVAGYPTAAQLAAYRSGGPWSAATVAGRLHNVGYAEGRAALAALADAHLHPGMVWIDVEQHTSQPWPTGTPTRRARNRYVVEGLLRSLADAGLAFGIYANTDAWRTVTGPWWLPGVPAWATVGTAGSGAARARCSGASLHSGPLYLVQWTDHRFDYDLPCRTFAAAVGRPATPQPFGDLDADWAGDLLAREPSGKLWRYPGNGAGGWQPRRLVGTGWQTMDVVEPVGDLSGDGRPDVLARQRGTGRVWLYSGDGRGGFTSRRPIATGWQGLDVVVGAGDVTGDGVPDVVARDTAGRLWLYPGDGRGRLGTRHQVGYGWQLMDLVVAAGDLTGDGHPDLVARERANGRLWLYAGTGAGGWAHRRQIGSGWQTMDALAGVGDVTGDGVPDLVARDRRTGALWLYPGNGSGGWLPRSRSGTGWAVMDRIG